ncbi:pentapeptide repeat-containing protein, partial [Rickettsiales bacterium]|nr:pentapeptide repeat-containing protein [Rickettsiales bacterium]
MDKIKHTANKQQTISAVLNWVEAFIKKHSARASFILLAVMELVFYYYLYNKDAKEMLSINLRILTAYAIVYGIASSRYNKQDQLIADLTNTAMNQIKEFKSGHLANEARNMQLTEMPNFFNFVGIFFYTTQTYDEETTWADEKEIPIGMKLVFENKKDNEEGIAQEMELEVKYHKDDEKEYLIAKSNGEEIKRILKTKNNWQGDKIWKEIYQKIHRRPDTIQSIKSFIASITRSRLPDSKINKTTSFDFSHIWLHGAKLIEANLIMANLYKTKLQGADLKFANLIEANLIEADLQGAYLEGANLIRANLQGAYLQGADLGWAKLQMANLGWTKLQGADLIGAKLQEAYLDRSYTVKTDGVWE